MTLDQILELERQNAEQQLQAKLRASREANKQAMLTTHINIVAMQTQGLVFAAIFGGSNE